MDAFFGMLTFILFCLYGLTLHSLYFRPPTITLLGLGEGVNKLLNRNFLGTEAFFGMLPFILFCFKKQR